MPDTISPTTRAAVRKAGEAARRAIAAPGCCVDVKPCELPPCHCARVGAIAAVSAYLRAQGRDSEARQVEACGDE